MHLISRTLLISLILTASAPALAFNLNDAVKAATDSQQDASAVAASTPEAQGLIKALTEQLDVSPQQAVGGIGALLGLAQNKLTGGEYDQLAQEVPGLDQLAGDNALGGLSQLGGLSSLLGGNAKDITGQLSGLLDHIDNQQEVDQTFDALGMNSGMSSQFANVILQYLGQQNIDASLLGDLSNLWGVGS
ncbi:uncharacterized protein VcgC/VcgE DUF2780 [Pseudomonas duriflava]|uniref:Uncharacterized protein VcgC/VcgE DUF2780 n=1 Tax=Pseudomonas duriflava TaxID=459528 RepID=A0A562QE83_9PSED|nr:DUF2780 domain-containing protein [Pseudomonas duriflava]TWI55058.1 uncharacterized protein VcgC/VcgE DUF2780 [Pseudomonas duriflava]